MKQYWTVKNKKDNFAEICREQGVTEVTARLLVNRGLTTKEERDAYLHPSFSCLPEAKLLKNAEAAAKMIADNELTGESLSQTINEIMGDEELQKQMCRASKEQGIPDASKRLYDVVNQIIKK